MWSDESNISVLLREKLSTQFGAHNFVFGCLVAIMSMTFAVMRSGLVVEGGSSDGRTFRMGI